jgi:hypothetical protein
MKNIKRKYGAFAIALIGLLVLVTCNDPLDGARVRSKQMGSRSLLEEGLQEEDAELDDEGCGWLTVFKEDGSMESVRIPVEEAREIDESQESIREPDAFMRILDRGIWDADSGMQNNQDIDDRGIWDADSGMRSSQGIDVLILGCGFTNTVAQKKLFEDKAYEVADHLRKTYPFNLYIELITVGSCLWASAQSGVRRDPNNGNNPNLNNVYRSTFYYPNGTGDQRVLFVGDINLVKKHIEWVRQNRNLNPAMTIVLANSTTYGGAATIGELAVSSINGDAPRIVTHELGHSFGRLKDEYWPGSGTEAWNMTKKTIDIQSNPIWFHWIDHDGIGKYLHTGSSTWYRPSSGKCHMEALSHEFCGVCSTVLINYMHGLTGKQGYLYDLLPPGNARITGMSPGMYPRGGVIIPHRVIPAFNDGRTVTQIGDYAFAHQARATNFTIPSSVTSIGEQAFSYCSRLTSINIPSGVTSIGESAFFGCTSLASRNLTGQCYQHR